MGEVKAPPIKQAGVKNVSVWDRMKNTRRILKKVQKQIDLSVGMVVYFDGYGEPLRGIVRLNDERRNGDVLVRYDGQPISHWTNVKDLWVEA